MNDFSKMHSGVDSFALIMLIFISSNIAEIINIIILIYSSYGGIFKIEI